MKPTIYDLDSFICSQLPVHPGKVARHKLAYAVHRYSVIKTGEPIVDSLVAALPLGPCFVELLENPDRKDDPDAFSAEARALIHTVLDKLGAMSGRALAARSHKNYYEWRMMREGMRPNQVKQNGQYVVIPLSMIHSLPYVERAGADVGYPLL